MPLNKTNLLLLFLLVFLLNSPIFSQSFVISFPQSPEDVSVCEDSSKLIVRLDALMNSSTNDANIEIVLPNGVEYEVGSVLKINGTSALSIIENGGTPNAPIFQLTTSTSFLGNFIEFEIKRNADCNVRDSVLAGVIFKDIVNATIDTVATNITSPRYSVLFPSLTLIQPQILDNVIVGNTYTRDFTIINGSEGCTENVYVNIDYQNNQITQQSLFLNGMALAPSSIVGSTYFYTITGLDLTTDGLFCNGEALVLTETVTVNSCNFTDTLYTAGWGCNADPSQWCQTVTGIGSLSLTGGVPEFTAHTQTKVGFTDMCTPFIMRSTFTNGGAGNMDTASMYNVTFRKSRVAASLLTMYSYDQRYNLGITTINGVVAPNVLVGGIYQVNVTDLFPTTNPDPDGVGIGLEDVDNDGFYDDIPPGNTVTLDTEFSFNCNNTCNFSINNHLFSSGINYDDSCGTNIQPRTPSHPMTFEMFQIEFSDASLIPANIDSNVPFTTRLAVKYYYLSNSFTTANTRYRYELTLPPGVTVVGNVEWFDGEFPTNIGTTGTPVIYTQTGNTVTITSPTPNFGWATIDLTYDCSSGNELNIDWKLKVINDITTPSCECLSELFCSSLITQSNCITTCPTVGVNTDIPIVKRAANSLGWTDNTMLTRQTESNITAYDLAKALYLDEIEIHSNGTQTGSAQDLFIRLQLDKAGTVNKLTPLNVDVTIIRAGIPIVPTTNLTSFSLTNSTTIEQFIDWNLSSILPVGGLLDGDEIKTVSRYQVAINDGLPTYDVQSGNTIFMYNIDPITNNILTCNTFVPEMYLVGTNKVEGTNQYVTNGCSVSSLGGGTSYIARRFDAGGLRYTNEFRPGMLINSIVVTMPSGYDFVDMTYNVTDNSGGSFPAIPDSIVGNVLTFNNPGTWPAMDITVRNQYGAIIPLRVTARCDTQEFEVIKRETFHTDYYYHYATASTLPMDNNLVTDRTITLFDKPSIELTDQTGTIQAGRPTESWTVRLLSNGFNDAPYSWLAIDDVFGVQIQNITHVTSGLVIAPTAYIGGNIYHLNTAGIPVGNYEEYNISFTYSVCVPTDIVVNAGWNCNSFPASPISSPCNLETVNLSFTSTSSNIEINSVTEPNSSIDICQPIPYEFHINNIEAGNTFDNTFSITSINGLNPEIGSFEIEYPVGSGNWESTTYMIDGTTFVYDLTLHTNYPVDGLPGTINDGGNVNVRAMAVRFNMITDCNFISGSSFQVKSNANSVCGITTTSDIIKESLPINVNGIATNYSVVNDLTLTAGSLSGCNPMATLTGTNTIISSIPINNTGFIEITIPEGFNYITGSFNCTSITYCPTITGVTTNALGNEIITLAIPAGMSSGDMISYTIAIQENPLNPVGCINETITIESFDELQNITCASSPTGNCSFISVQTGISQALNFTIEKAILDITVNSVTSTINGLNEDITANFTINNNSTTIDSDSNVEIEAFYDLNNDNLFDAGDLLLGSTTLSNSILAGNSITENISFTATPNQVCDILLVIRFPQNPCICDTTFISLPSPILLANVAGLDNATCNNNTIQIGSNNNTAYIYNWTATNPAILAYLDATTISDPNFSYLGPTLTTLINLTYTLNITRPNGCVSSDEVVITVNPTPIVTVPSNQEVCNNTMTNTVIFTSATVGTTYTWTNDNSTIGLASSGTGDIPAFTAVNTSTSPVTAMISVIPTFNGCVGTAETFSITVNPTPIVTVPSNQEVCNNTMTNAVIFTSATVGTTYTWTNDNSTIGLASSGTGDIPAFTAVNTSASPVTAIISVTPTFNGCVGTAETFSITVNPTPIVTVPSNQEVCNNTMTNTVIFTSATVGTTYTWTNDNSTIGLASSGTGDIPAFTAVNTSTSPVTAMISVIPTFNGCVGTAETFSITVNPTPVVTVPSNQEVCNNTMTNAVIFTSATVGTTYTWTNDNSTIGLASSGTGDIPAFTAVNTSASPVTAIISVTPTFNGCVGTAETFSITVNPTPIVTVPSNQEVCNNTMTNTVIFTSATVGTTYTWTNDNSTIGLASSGTGDIPAFTAVNTSTSPVTAMISVIPTFNGCVGTAETFSITVNPTPVVTVPSNQEVCNNTMNTVIFTSATVGTTYTWTNDNSTIGLASSGTGDIPAFTAVNTSASPVTAIISVTPTFNGCVGTVETFSITVNPTPIVTVPSNQEVCNNTMTNTVIFTSATVGTTYTWTNDNSTIGLASSGTGDIPAFTAVNTSTSPVTAMISVIPTFNGCVGTAETFSITVNPTPVVTVPSNQEVCNNTMNTVIFTSATVGTTYTWTNDNSTIGLASSGTGDIPAFTAVNTSASPVTAIISVTPTFNGCVGTVETFSITVNPTPIVTVPSNQEVCNNTMTNTVIFTSATVGTTYTWTNDNSTIGLASSGTGDIPAFTAVNTSTSPVTAMISVIPTFNGCVGTAETFSITVNPTPIVTVPSNQEVCNNTMTNAVIFTSTTVGTTYTWTNDNSTIGLASSGTGDIPAFTAVNTSASPVTAIISVTPTFNGCVGTVETFSITVNPTPIVTVPSNQEVCNNTMTNTVIFTSATVGTTYTWTNDNSTIGLASSGTGDIPAFTAVNTSTSPVTAMISVIPTFNGCVGTAETFSITVNPTPIVTVPSNQEVCNNTMTNAVIFTSTTVGTTYTWTNDNSTIGLASSGTGDIPAFTAVNTSASPVTAIISVTPTFNGCVGTAETFSITIDAILDPSFNYPNLAVCINSNDPIPNITTPGGVFSVEPNVFINPTTGELDISSAEPGILYTITYTIVSNTNTICTSAQVTRTLEVYELPNFELAEEAKICPMPGVDIPISITNPEGNYSYEWFDSNDVSVGSGTTLILNDPNQIGTYTVIAKVPTNDPLIFCESSQSITVTLDQQAILANTHVIDFNGANNLISFLVVGGSGDYTYILTDSNGNEIVQDNDPVFRSLLSEIYSIRIIDNLGCSIDLFKNNIIILDYPLFFTPNGDGYNETWNITNSQLIPNSKIYIFDRFGKVIAKIDPNGSGWDGTYLGKIAYETDYWFTVEFIDTNTNLIRIVKGHFSLRR